MSQSPVAVTIPRLPREFNAAVDLLAGELVRRGSKIAYVDRDAAWSYHDLAARVDRCANMLRALGIEPEQRILLCLLDSVDFPTAFLGAIKAGIIPVPVNTLLRSDDYAFLLRDSRARALLVSAELLPAVTPIAGSSPWLRHLIVSGAPTSAGQLDFRRLLEQAPAQTRAAETVADEACFWLYTSGSTGKPKAAVHAHSSMRLTAELYAKSVLQLSADEVIFSAAKLFFAYGLGNSLSFPLAVGASSVLLHERPTPEAVSRILRDQGPTVFFGVPTLYAALLAHPGLPSRDEVRLRYCVSAGEALPAEIGRRWEQRFGCPILDGIGSTEMLHVYLSNRPGAVTYGSTGKPIPGYDIRLIDEDGADVAAGEIGELHVRGPTAALGYWNQRDKSRATFRGDWLKTGDKYRCDASGTYIYCGRNDDMLKVGGIYVSPFEVEAAILSHEAVLEVAVIGQSDEHDLVKPKAIVVAKPGYNADAALAAALQQHVKTLLAPYKYPRWIEFVAEIPKTATGKMQRFKLRERNSA
jgi:benzoate-CoA ligase